MSVPAPPPDSPENSRPDAAVRPDALPHPPSSSRLPSWIPPLFYLLLAVLFLWRSTLGGEVFLPAGMLGHVAPWTARIPADRLPPWNPLRWDGIAQYYPWRAFAAKTMRAGTIPLWNPYQFSGTPFVANSQSAALYPGNILFYLLSTPQAFGWSAVLHLTLSGWFLYLLLRRLRCGEGGALLGGIVYAYSAWEVAWLQLPTFLATSCWFPLLLRQVHVLAGYAPEAGTPRRASPTTLPGIAGLGAVVGMMLLAGHLQIAFYGLLAGSLWAVCLFFARLRERGGAAAARFLAACVGGLVLGLMLAAPQILPTLELSRVSHRTGRPTKEGYQAYIDYALPPGGLVLLTLPEFYGGDTDPDNPYWGFYNRMLPNGTVQSIRHNAAETAAYVGIVPLLLGTLALLRARRKASGEGNSAASIWDRRALFLGGLALLALFLALGTPLDALFYFRVPGFGQSGSPARALGLWALAWAALAGLGLDALQRRAPTARELATAAAVIVLIAAGGLGLAATAIQTAAPTLTVPAFADVLPRIGPGWARLALGLLGGFALLLPWARRALRPAGTQTAASSAEGLSVPAPAGSQTAEPSLIGRLPVLVPAGVLLALIELFWAGIGLNPTAKPEWAYPETPGIALLRARAGHQRVFPVNQRWNLYKSPPAVFPPNAATVYGLRDVQGYDSLFTGQYKAFANQFARPNTLGMVDASPPEVGNMVFFQNPNAPLVPDTAAAFALTPSTSSSAFQSEAAPPGSPLYNGDNDMAVYPLPGALPRARFIPDTPLPGSAVLPPVRFREDGPTRVVLEVIGPAGVLNLADAFYPGWRAEINHKPVPILRQAAAPIYRAVAVPAGGHIVSFRYDPASFRVGLYLACLACMLLMILRCAGVTARA